jgi:DNA mismatch endonuclease (patch repair protein)
MHPDREARSRIMAAIRKRDTKPELVVRRALHARGLRFRLYRNDLPGCPDITFPSRNAVLFVHGCFWHRCPHCVAGKKTVRSNAAYWLPKLERNRARDARVKAELERQGWTVLSIWECQVNDDDAIQGLAQSLLSLRPKRLISSA